MKKERLVEANALNKKINEIDNWMEVPQRFVDKELQIVRFSLVVGGRGDRNSNWQEQTISDAPASDSINKRINEEKMYCLRRILDLVKQERDELQRQFEAL